MLTAVLTVRMRTTWRISGVVLEVSMCMVIVLIPIVNVLPCLGMSVFRHIIRSRLAHSVCHRETAIVILNYSGTLFWDLEAIYCLHSY